MKRGLDWRPTRPGANPAATAKVERRVSAEIFMVDGSLCFDDDWMDGG
jgi:hypothetical protein